MDRTLGIVEVNLRSLNHRATEPGFVPARLGETDPITPVGRGSVCTPNLLEISGMDSRPSKIKGDSLSND